MMSEKNKEVALKLVEAVNTRNHDLLDEIMTRAFVRHCHATPDAQVNSREEMKQFLRADLQVFPDARVDTQFILAEGDLVAGYFTYSGTQKGPIGRLPATNRKAELGYLGILRFEDGKIAEMWVEWDNLAMLSQLGHWPPEGMRTA